MSHISLYLDKETEKIVRAAARNSRQPISKWVAGVVKMAARDTWSDEFKQLAGSWPDFPSAESLRSTLGRDAPRVDL